MNPRFSLIQTAPQYLMIFGKRGQAILLHETIYRKRGKGGENADHQDKTKEQTAERFGAEIDLLVITAPG